MAAAPENFWTKSWTKAFFSGLGTVAGVGVEGGGIRRMMAGSVLGGGIGLALNDDPSSTSQFAAGAKGALAGLGVGALTTGVAGSTYRAIGRMPHALSLYKTGKFTLGEAVKTAKGASLARNIYGAVKEGAAFATSSSWDIAGRSASFALRHPVATLTAGMGLGAYAYMGGGGGKHGHPIAHAALSAANDYTDRRDSSRERFVDSASGLTLGLHSGRHG